MTAANPPARLLPKAPAKTDPVAYDSEMEPRPEEMAFQPTKPPMSTPLLPVTAPVANDFVIWPLLNPTSPPTSAPLALPVAGLPVTVPDALELLIRAFVPRL